MTSPEVSGDTVREAAFGQSHSLTVVDRFGVWLSSRLLLTHSGPLDGKDVGDFGCGFEASFARRLVGKVRSLLLVDIALAPDLHGVPGVTAVEGLLPGALTALPSESLDVVMCISVLEHLWEPDATLKEMRRLLRPGGVCIVNVPSWRGKRLLELSAFRLGLSPAAEMNDHKTYYDPKDLWPMLRRAGFQPDKIHCSRAKFGLNTFAACRVAAGGEKAE